MFAAEAAGRSGQLAKDSVSTGNECCCLVETSSRCSEEELRARLSPFGLAWCNSVDSGRYLVRFLSQEGLLAAVKTLHGTNWLGEAFSIAPYSVGQLLSGAAQYDSGGTPSADSISTRQLPEQLDYFSAILQEEQQLQELQQLGQQAVQQQQQHGRAPIAPSAFQSQALQELEPCDAQWNPAVVGDSSLLVPLEEQGSFTADASPLQSFSSSTSTCQLWSQRSIGAVARKDLAKFAAMQLMALQNSSCNSPTQASLLAAGHHVMGLGSPWGSTHSVQSSGSLASLALNTGSAGNTGPGIFQDGTRRASSPSGQQQLRGHSSLGTASGAGTPKSFSTAAGERSFGSGSLQQQPQQQQGQGQGSGSSRGSGWPGQNPSLTVNLPSELGLGDSSAMADEEVMRLNNMAAARRQQQQQLPGHPMHLSIRTGLPHSSACASTSALPNFAGLLSSYGSESSNSPLAGGPLVSEHSGGFLSGATTGAGGGSSSRFATPRSFNGHNGAASTPDAYPAGSPHPFPPPPPPPHGAAGGAAGGMGQQPGTAGTPPPGLLGQQPPPPPPPGGSRTPPAQGPLLDSFNSSSCDGPSRGAGAISPVQPAPPPRSITPGGGGGGGGGSWGQQAAAGSGSCSPRVGGMSQPQSPSNGYRGPPRPTGLRGFQHNMSNLGINSQTPQHGGGYDGYGGCAAAAQQAGGYDGYGGCPAAAQPPFRGNSPMGGHRPHSPCGVPPPPPPSNHIPPGYVAAATAAANACGFQVSPVPSPPPPVGGGLGMRPGSACAPLNAAASGPVGGNPLSSMVSTPTGRAACAAGPVLLPHGSAPVPTAATAAATATTARGNSSSSSHDSSNGTQHRKSGNGAAKAAAAGSSTGGSSSSMADSKAEAQQQQLKADGALFVEELLQLLKQPGATAGNAFLSNLTDLLECALGSAAAAAAAGSTTQGSPTSLLGSSTGHSSRRSSNDDAKAAAAAAAAAAAVIAANGSSKVPLLQAAAVAEGVARAALASSSSNTPRTARGNRESKGTAAEKPPGRQVPVDAAAFLGMLQEAAAPLLAAAAAATAAAAASNRAAGFGNMSSSGRRAAAQQRASEVADNSSTGGGRGQSQGGDSRDGRGSRGGLRSSMVSVSSNSSSSHPPGATSDAGAPTEGNFTHSNGGSNDLTSLPLSLLLRHSLAGGSKGGAGAPLLFPLHPRTTTHSSCGGTAPGTPHGTPMLLVPQTVPELLSTRAALIRLLLSAHAFIHGPVYARMASRLAGIEELYDSMHEDPVVVKRRKCRDMAAMRDVIKRDTSFTQAVSSVSSMRNHIYSLSRKVLIGFGHMESLPIDLLLGGLTSELAAILAEPCDALQLGQQDGSNGGSNGGSNAGSNGGSNGGSGAVPRSSIGTSSAGTPRDARPSNPSSGSNGGGRSGNEAGGSNGGSDGLPAAGMADVSRIVLPAHVADFLTSALPVPKLALLVFVEFVPVDPAPCSTALPPSGLGAPDGWGSCSSGGRLQQHNPGSKDRRSSSASTAEHVAAALEGSQGGNQTSGGGNATPRNRSGHHGRWGHGREQRDGGASGHNNGGHGNGPNRLRESGGGGSGSGNTPNTPRRGSRGNSFSSGGGSGSEANKRNSSRRSGHGGFDLVAEAAALEAAASAAAPLVAAAVCDLPTSNRRQGSNTGSSS